MPRFRLKDWNDHNASVIACRVCPRLVAWRETVAREKRKAFREQEYWGKPVIGFGDRRAQLLILGLAPAAHGANRTGRMFTGDMSGATLMAALHRAGLANQPTSVHAGDGLSLDGAFITAAVRCAPPQNKPSAQERSNCQVFLERELELLTNLTVVLTLGRFAFDAYKGHRKRRGTAVARWKFRHGAVYEGDPHLVACYHPSQRNTQTGLLTPEMLDEVMAKIAALMTSQ